MSTEIIRSTTDLQKKFGKMTVGLFLKAFREADGLSQVGFSKKLKISRANLCDIEKGRKLISLDRVKGFSAKIGVAQEILLKLAIQDMLERERLNYRVELKAA